jgi:hypothetical protein
MTAGAACPICGASQQTCGPATSGAAPLDLDDAIHRQGTTMAELREYEYVSNGTIVTAMLSPQDAVRLGAVEVAAGAPAAKSRIVADKSRVAPDKG